MGICFQDAKMMYDARLNGVVFRNTATIGHQSLFLHPAEIKHFERELKRLSNVAPSKSLSEYQFGDYSDHFLREFLSVDTLTVVDVSAYEGADTIHDLNAPIPDSLADRFNAVIDSGSLEHIFNFPVAVSNLMRMVRVGGSIFMTTPANNLCGHGFYQFSPELMFRVFTAENGFELRRVVVFESKFPQITMSSNRRAYEVMDPVAVGSRIGLVSKRPVSMMFEARKIADVPLFVNPPLQSDFVTLWKSEGDDSTVATGLSLLVRKAFGHLPSSIQNQLYGYRERRRFSLSNPRFYKRIS